MLGRLPLSRAPDPISPPSGSLPLMAFLNRLKAPPFPSPPHVLPSHLPIKILMMTLPSYSCSQDGDAEDRVLLLVEAARNSKVLGRSWSVRPTRVGCVSRA